MPGTSLTRTLVVAAAAAARLTAADFLRLRAAAAAGQRDAAGFEQDVRRKHDPVSVFHITQLDHAVHWIAVQRLQKVS